MKNGENKENVEKKRKNGWKRVKKREKEWDKRRKRGEKM